MKKTYYHKILNPCIALFFTGFICIICSFLLNISMNSLQRIAYLAFFYQFVSMVYIISLFVAIIAFFSLLVLVYHEAFLRLKEDNLTNLWKSVYQTLTIRIFLRQSEHSETVTTVEQVKVTRYNPINKYFNRAVRKGIVDIRENKVTLIIRIPKTQQATKILKDMEMLICEEIANRNPDYYFSRPERNGKWLYFIGTKRK